MRKIVLILLLFSGLLHAQTRTDSVVLELEEEMHSIKESNAEKVALLIKLSEYYRNIAATNSLEYSSSAIAISQKLNLHEEFSRSCRSHAKTFAFIGENDKAWHFFQKALDNDQSNALKKSETKTLQNIGDFLLQLNDYSHATDYYIQSLENTKDLKDTALLASQYKKLAQTFEKTNNSDKALEYYFQSISYYEELDELLLIGEIYNSIGNIYLKEQNFDKSIAYFTRSYNIIKANDFTNTVFNPTISLGNIYMARKDFDLAQKFFDEAYKEENEQNNKLGISNAEMQLGLLQSKLGNYNLAETYFNKALAGKQTIGDVQGVIDLHINISELQYTQKNYKKALAHNREAQLLANKSGSAIKLLSIYKSYSTIYQAQKDLTKALEYSHKYATLADSIATEELNSNINEFNEFIVQSVNRTNELLEIDNQKQQHLINKKGFLVNFIITGFLLLLITAAVFYYFSRKRLRDKVEIDTQKKLYDEMLVKFQSSEEKYKAVVDQTHDIIYIQKKDRIIFANKQAIEISGYTRDEFYEKKVTELIAPEDLDEHYERTLNRENGDNQLLKFKAKLKDKHGTIRTFEILSRQIELNNEIVILGSGRDLTEHEATEDLLHKNEQLYKSLVQNSPNGIIYIDTNGNIIEKNKSAFNLLSINNEAIYGSVNFYEIFPDANSIIFSDIDKCINKGEIINNAILLDIDGKRTYLNYYLSPLFNKDGSVYSLIMNFEDITEKKKFENDLMISEERSKLAFEGTNLGLWDWDISSGKMIFNKVFYHLLGYAPGEIKNTRDALDPLTSPSDRDKIKALIQNHLNNESDFYKHEYKVLTKNGTWTWISDQGKVVLRDKDNKPLRMVGTIRDITLQKTSEEKVLQSEKKYRSLIDNMQDGVFIFQDFEVKFANEALANILGYSIDELRKMSVSEMVAAEHLQTIKDRHKSRIEGIKTDSSYEIEMIHKNGNRIFVSLSVGVVHYKGKPASHGTVKDITESRKSQSILKQSELSLRDANATKDKFFSIIAHDLKNPFNAIMGFSNLLYEDFDDFTETDKRKFIKNIWDAAESTYKLLENLLHWSRAQTGNISYKPEHVDLSIVANENITVLKPHAEGKRIKLSSNIGYTTEVFADTNMIHTVIRNLVSNAVKFTKKGGSVTISSRADGEFEQICITDTGIGISKENISKLFKIDEQFKTDGTANEKGTGLGLILCKEFVEKNGGRIWVESELGKGSKFCFTVPKKSDQQALL